MSIDNSGSEEQVNANHVSIDISKDEVRSQERPSRSWKSPSQDNRLTFVSEPDSTHSYGMTNSSATPYLSQSEARSIDTRKAKLESHNYAFIESWINGSISWAVFVCLLTVWALFIDDVKLLCMPKSVDVPVLIVNLFVLCVFLVELILCWIVQRGYAWSLASLLDCLAAVSLIPLEDILEEVDGVDNNISISRVARAARALRILRATRAAVMALKTERRMQLMKQKLKGEQTSVLSDTLMQSTNIKMLFGIVVLLMGVTLLDTSESDMTPQTGLYLLDRSYGQEFYPSPETLNKSSQWNTMWQDYRRTVEGLDDDSHQRLKKLKVWGVTYLDLSVDDLRKRELVRASIADSRSIAEISKRGIVRQQAINSLLLTIFAVVVIILWSWSFRRDHTKFVIEPVNRMIRVLRQMALDPRQAVDKANEDITMNENLGNEMIAIESCIRKFGGLLKVGFGEAGMGIIERNFRHLNKDKFDPVVPGVIVKAVFGFCDIRNFTDCCEVLNEDTMIFTNKIARIVHELVEESGGTVNKNIGDAFLSVWKVTEIKEDSAHVMNSRNSTTALSFCSSDEKISIEGRRSLGSRSSASEGKSYRTKSQAVSISDQYRSESQPVTAAMSRCSRSTRRTRKSFSHHLSGATDTNDAALRSFLKINELLRNSEDIQKLSADPRLQNKMPGYKVRLGSGLHFGWAIEGAVGTSHKVDATYLSPHVNMAARLEAATKQYSVNIMLSEALVNGLSMALYAECRPVDRVTVKGSAKPVTLYVHMPSEAPELTDELRHEFMEIWNEAFINYESGNHWHVAADLIHKCLQILPEDGPAKVLLEVIKDADGKAPLGWPGYRELTSK